MSSQPDKLADPLRVIQQRARLVAWLTRLLGRRDVAEEVAQETYLKLHRKDPTRAVWDWPYLQAVANTTAIDRIRYERRRPAPAEPDCVAESLVPERRHSPVDPIFDAACHSEFAAELRSCVHDLPPSLRQVIELRFLRQMSRQEVADELHISVGAVEQRLTRALSQLRERARATFGAWPG